jgi:hypothetical protein
MQVTPEDAPLTAMQDATVRLILSQSLNKVLIRENAQLRERVERQRQTILRLNGMKDSYEGLVEGLVGRRSELHNN